MSGRFKRGFLSSIFDRVARRLAFKTETVSLQHEFGEDSILQQVDPVARCPRTGLPAASQGDSQGCQLADGACSELAANGIRVACLVAPESPAVPHGKAA